MDRVFVFLVAMAAMAAYAQVPPWGQVDFNNHRTFSTTADRIYRFLDGTSIIGTNYVAQLYYGTNAANLIPVTNPPARFRNVPSTDPLAGTWSGGTRTLVGISPGMTATLQVRFWDSDWARTYEEAAINRSFRFETATFTYKPPAPGPPPPNPTDFYMEGLRGAFVPCPFFGPPGIVSQPESQVAYVGQTVILSAVTTNTCGFQWQFNGTNLFAGRWGPLRINNVQLHHQGDYRVIVAPGSPPYSITSQVARLTVYPAPQLTLPHFDNGAFAFHVSEDTGRTVVIETAADLNPATIWTPVLTNTAPFWFTNSTPADRQRFYRTRF